MDELTQSQRLQAEIRNAAWLVRYYRRPTDRNNRAAAIRDLGAVVQRAFTECDDYEQLLLAIVDGLTPQEPVQRF